MNSSIAKELVLNGCDCELRIVAGRAAVVFAKIDKNGSREIFSLTSSTLAGLIAHIEKFFATAVGKWYDYTVPRICGGAHSGWLTLQLHRLSDGRASGRLRLRVDGKEIDTPINDQQLSHLLTVLTTAPKKE